jgi:hypothetical protein
MVEDKHGPFANAEAFSRHLAGQIPPLRCVLDEHLVDNFGKVLPHLFMGDVTRWYMDNGSAGEGSEVLSQLLELLDRGLTTGSPDVRELIQVSFVENLPTAQPTGSALARLTPALKADYARYSGIHLER